MPYSPKYLPLPSMNNFSRDANSFTSFCASTFLQFMFISAWPSTILKEDSHNNAVTIDIIRSHHLWAGAVDHTPKRKSASAMGNI